MNPASDRPVDPADVLRTALDVDRRPVPWTAPAVVDLVPHFPELQLHGLVGQGGMAAVYRATQTRLGRPVALKVMRGDLASQPQFVDRFVREARALAALGNAHVLAIHDFGERGGYCYLVTEFVDGANLRELMQLGRLSPAEVLRIVPQICDGLYFAHRHGIVHRDIKPENVLVDRDGVVKLADFGLAKLAGDPLSPGLTGSGVVGTPHYMAPEQWRGGVEVDHRADIYSLGVVLYELLTGRLPVGSYSPASQQPGVPRGVDEVVQRSLQQEPERRYQDVREVQRDLEQQGRGLPGTVPPTPFAHSARGWLSASATVLVLGTAALLLFWNHEYRLEARYFAFEQQAAQVELAMANVRAAIDAGKAWTSGVPAAPEPVSQAMLPPWIRDVVLAAGIAAVGALVLLTAAIARRRLRFASGSPVQFVVANLLLWSPVLVPTFGWLAMQAARHGGPNHLLEFPALLVMFLVLFFAVRALWGAAARRPAGEPGPLTAGAGAGITVAVVLLAACVGGAVSIPRVGPPVCRVRVPVAAEQLIGLSREQVLDRLGPPRSIATSAEGMTWAYLGLDGLYRADALSLIGDHVGAVTAADQPLMPEPAPATGPHRGQLLAEVSARLGAAVSRTVGPLSTQLEYADGTKVTVANNGIVVDVQH